MSSFSLEKVFKTRTQETGNSVQSLAWCSQHQVCDRSEVRRLDSGLDRLFWSGRNCLSVVNVQCLIVIKLKSLVS
jgi:hypothetical protein